METLSEMRKRNSASDNVNMCTKISKQLSGSFMFKSVCCLGLFGVATFGICNQVDLFPRRDLLSGLPDTFEGNRMLLAAYATEPCKELIAKRKDGKYKHGDLQFMVIEKQKCLDSINGIALEEGKRASALNEAQKAIMNIGSGMGVAEINAMTADAITQEITKLGTKLKDVY